MKGKQTMFFAVEDDLYAALEQLEKNFDLEYVETGRFETKDPIVYKTFTQILNFGYSQQGNWLGPSYLLKPKNLTLNVEEFVLTKGGVVYLIYQKFNKSSIELTVGGTYTKKENILIAGRVATISDDPVSTRMYKSLLSKVKKQFKRIGVFYVGPKAEEKLLEGWRLATDVKSPREYDLVL